MRTLTFVIMHKERNDFWSNEFGWVEHPDMADEFTAEESERLILPIEGMWVTFKTAENIAESS